MIKLSLNEYHFQNMTDLEQQRVRQMAQEFGANAGIDWEWETRWLSLTAEAYMLAQLKYDDILCARHGWVIIHKT